MAPSLLLSIQLIQLSSSKGQEELSSDLRGLHWVALEYTSQPITPSSLQAGFRNSRAMWLADVSDLWQVMRGQDADNNGVFKSGSRALTVCRIKIKTCPCHGS